MIRIREAGERDNEALVELQKRCPQGTSFILGVDSSPDYFARSQSFNTWRVFVALDGDNIVGSAACAIRDTYIAGRQFKTAYEYGFIVDPQHRRRGIAARLQERIERLAQEENLEVLHLDIAEENIPSIHLFSKLGFKKVKDCATFSLMVYRKQKLAREANIRAMKENDVDTVADLINEMYHDYDFFAPFRSKDLAAYIRRMPYFDFRDILVFEDTEEIKACLGCWDYTKVRRYIVQKFNWRSKVQLFLVRLMGLFTKMPNVPKLGEPLLSYNLALLAYKDPASITELIKQVINLALENNIKFLHVPLDLESPAAAVVSQFRHTKLKLHYFIKPLKHQALSNIGKNRLYIDISEI